MPSRDPRVCRVRNVTPSNASSSIHLEENQGESTKQAPLVKDPLLHPVLAKVGAFSGNQTKPDCHNVASLGPFCHIEVFMPNPNMGPNLFLPLSPLDRGTVQRLAYFSLPSYRPRSISPLFGGSLSLSLPRPRRCRRLASLYVALPISQS